MTVTDKPVPMIPYLCWIAGQRADTEEEIVAASSFEARKVLAHKYRLSVFDAIAQRQDR